MDYKPWSRFKLAEHINENNGYCYNVSAYFTDKDTGWIGGNNVIFHTMDGGKTWVKQLIYAKQKVVAEISCVDNRHCLARTSGELFRYKPDR